MIRPISGTQLAIADSGLSSVAVPIAAGSPMTVTTDPAGKTLIIENRSQSIQVGELRLAGRIAREAGDLLAINKVHLLALGAMLEDQAKRVNAAHDAVRRASLKQQIK